MKPRNSKVYDTIIIGGGFYGLRIAQFLYDELGVKKILVIEKEEETVQRASYNNQARVHGGYHYPRSVLTAIRSKVNLPIFTEEYKDSVVTDMVKYYAVARNLSKVNASQFYRFFDRIGAEIKVAPEAMNFFNPKMVEQVYLTKEYVFDAAKLKKNLLKNLESRKGIKISTKEEAIKVASGNDHLVVDTDKSSYDARYVINATYSSINHINQASNLPLIPLKHELTELCLVEIPPSLEGKAFTVMCGPFFSLMPFPAKNAYTLSHVRYTPHKEWHDMKDGVKKGQEELEKLSTNFVKMWSDLRRYMPEAENTKYKNESLWEVKTVLSQSEGDDSRPILYRDHHGGLRNYICIMGGKIDNIYDVYRELKATYA